MSFTFQLETSIENDDYIKLVWPIQIYQNDIQSYEFPTAQLYDLKQNSLLTHKQIQPTKQINITQNSQITYYNFDMPLLSDRAYTIQITFHEYFDYKQKFIDIAAVNPIQIFTVSAPDDRAAVYDENKAFVIPQYQDIDEENYDMNMYFVNATYQSGINNPYQNLKLKLNLKEFYDTIIQKNDYDTQTLSQGFYIQVQLNKAIVNNKLDNCNIQNINGECYVLHNKQLIIYEIKDNIQLLLFLDQKREIYIEFQHEILPTGQSMFPVVYFSQRVSGHYQEKDKLMTMGKYYRVNYHISLPYKINLNENENFHNIFTYHYGLDSFVNTADPIVYFSDDSYPVYNNIGVQFWYQGQHSYAFKLDSSDIYSKGYFIIKLKMQATTILQGSIRHNLVGFDNQPVVCEQDASNTEWIQCKYVSQIQLNQKMFIKARYHYSQVYTTLGNILIEQVIYENKQQTSIETISQINTELSTPQFRFAKKFVDITSTNKPFSNTQAISVQEDTSQPNFNQIRSQVFSSTQATGVGLFNNIEDDQAIVFPLKIDKEDFCGDYTTTSDPCYDHNSNSPLRVRYVQLELISSSISMKAKRGLDMAFLDPVGIDGFISPPCVSDGNCKQSVNLGGVEKIHEFTLNEALDFPDEKYYKMKYGCYTEDQPIVDYCNFLSGHSGGATEPNGFLVMREANLFQQFSSQSLLVDENQYDFQINLKRARNSNSLELVSSTMIHGYGLRKINELSFQGTFVNMFTENTGVQIPTFFRLRMSNFPQSTNTKIAVFFDDSIAIEGFRQNHQNDETKMENNYYPCTIFSPETTFQLSSKKCIAHNKNTTDLETNSIYPLNQVIVSEPIDTTGSSTLDILFPVQTYNITHTKNPRFIHAVVGKSLSQNLNIGLDDLQPQAIFTINGPNYNGLDQQSSIRSLNQGKYQSSPTESSDYQPLGLMDSEKQYEYSDSAGVLEFNSLQLESMVFSGQIKFSAGTSFTPRADSNNIGSAYTLMSIGYDMFIQPRFYTTGNTPCYKFQYQRLSKTNQTNGLMRYGAFCPVHDESARNFELDYNYADSQVEIDKNSKFPAYFSDFSQGQPLFTVAVSEALGRLRAINRPTTFLFQGTDSYETEIAFSFQDTEQLCIPTKYTFNQKLQFTLTSNKNIPMSSFNQNSQLIIQMKNLEFTNANIIIDSCKLPDYSQSSCTPSYEASGQIYKFSLKFTNPDGQDITTLKVLFEIQNSNTALTQNIQADFTNIQIFHDLHNIDPQQQIKLADVPSSSTSSLHVCDEPTILNISLNLENYQLQSFQTYKFVPVDAIINFSIDRTPGQFPKDFGLTEGIIIQLNQDWILNQQSFLFGFGNCDIHYKDSGALSHDFKYAYWDNSNQHFYIEFKNSRKILPVDYQSYQLKCYNLFQNEDVFPISRSANFYGPGNIQQNIGSVVYLNGQNCAHCGSIVSTSLLGNTCDIITDGEDYHYKILPGMRKNSIDLFISDVTGKTQTDESHLYINFINNFSLYGTANKNLNLKCFFTYDLSIDSKDFEELDCLYSQKNTLQVTLKGFNNNFYIRIQGITYNHLMLNKTRIIRIYHSPYKDQENLNFYGTLFSANWTDAPYIPTQISTLQIISLQYSELSQQGVSNLDIKIQFLQSSTNQCLGMSIDFPYNFNLQENQIQYLQCEFSDNIDYNKNIECISYKNGIITFNLPDCLDITAHKKFSIKITSINTPDSSTIRGEGLKINAYNVNDNNNIVYTSVNLQSNFNVLPKFTGTYKERPIFRWKILPPFSREVPTPEDYIKDPDFEIPIYKGRYSGTIAIYWGQDTKFPYSFRVYLDNNSQSSITTYSKTIVAQKDQQYLFIDFGLDTFYNQTQQTFKISTQIYPTYKIYENFPYFRFKIMENLPIIQLSSPVQLAYVQPEIQEEINFSIGTSTFPLRFQFTRPYLLSQENTLRIEFEITPSISGVSFKDNKNYYDFISKQNHNIYNEYIGVILEIDSIESLVDQQFQLKVKTNQWVQSLNPINITITASQTQARLLQENTVKINIIGTSQYFVLIQPQCTSQQYIKYEIQQYNALFTTFNGISTINTNTDNGIILYTQQQQDQQQTQPVQGGFLCNFQYNIQGLQAGKQYIAKFFYNNDQNITYKEFQTEEGIDNKLIILKLTSVYYLSDQKLADIFNIDIRRLKLVAPNSESLTQIMERQQDPDNLLTEKFNFIYYINPDIYNHIQYQDTLNMLQSMIYQETELKQLYNQKSGHFLENIEIQNNYTGLVSHNNLPQASVSTKIVGDDKNLEIHINMYGGDGQVSVVFRKVQYSQNIGPIDWNLVLTADGYKETSTGIFMKKDSSKKIFTIEMSRDDDYQNNFYVYLRVQECSTYEIAQITQQSEYIQKYIYDLDYGFQWLYVVIPLLLVILILLGYIAIRSYNKRIRDKVQQIQIDTADDRSERSLNDRKKNTTINHHIIQEEENDQTKNQQFSTTTLKPKKKSNPDKKIFKKELQVQNGKVVETTKEVKKSELQKELHDLEQQVKEQNGEKLDTSTSNNNNNNNQQQTTNRDNLNNDDSLEDIEEIVLM